MSLCKVRHWAGAKAEMHTVNLAGTQPEGWGLAGRPTPGRGRKTTRVQDNVLLM